MMKIYLLEFDNCKTVVYLTNISTFSQSWNIKEKSLYIKEQKFLVGFKEI